MAEEWRNIRVRQSTWQALSDLMDSRELSAIKGEFDRWWNGEDLTFDQMIRFLVQQQQRKAERSRESRERARERRRAELLASAWTVIAEADQES